MDRITTRLRYAARMSVANAMGDRGAWARRLSGCTMCPILVVLVAILSIVGLPGCSSPSPAAANAERSRQDHELVASVRSEPRTFNGLMGRDQTSSLVSHLTQAPLVRINRVNDRLEPWLAERWTRSEDDLSYVLHLRTGVRFSDGSAFTADDVLFTFEALYDSAVTGPLPDALKVSGKKLQVTALDETTVVVTFPKPFSPGIRILGSLPMLPKHRLQHAYENGTLAEVWGVSTPTAELAGLGPFVLSEYQPGQRLIFDRNPYYWRRDQDGQQLPRLDRLTLEIVPDQDAEMLRFEAREIDFIQSEVRPEDYAPLRRAADEGRIQLIDLGVALDADFLFFNLKREAKAADPRQSWLQADDFRRAIAHAVDRESFSKTVYRSLGEPVHGPVTASNHRWHDPTITPHQYDPGLARSRLAGLGLRDRDGDSMLEDESGYPVRFILLTQRGHSVRERATAVIAEDLRKIGITVDVVALEFGALIERLSQMDFDAAYLGFRTSDTDPAVNLDLWLSGSAFHFWNPSQPDPATPWEAQIDTLMAEQMTTFDQSARRQLFNRVQAIFADHVPAIYFAAPRVVIALSPRVANARPALLAPMMLWNADTLTSTTRSVQPGSGKERFTRQ